MSIFDKRGLFRVVAIAMVTLALPACTSATAPTRFYALTPVGEPNPAAAANRNLAIGVDPVGIPGYLDRPQIVTRLAPSRFALGEFDQWAEPFHGMVTRILAEDLYRTTGVKEITALPQTHETRLDRIVDVTLLRFDAEANAVILEATWRILDRNDKVLAGGRFETQSPVANMKDYEALVIAMSQALGQLAQKIAEGLR